MFCPAPVVSFNYRTVQSWLKRNCWIDQRPAGECVTTSLFIQVIFGWPCTGCEYHVWNKHPSGLVLDLTVGQYRRQHSTKLVWPATIFDVEGTSSFTYASMEQANIEREVEKLPIPLFAWLERLQMQMPVRFGLPRQELSTRVNEAVKVLRNNNQHNFYRRIALTSD